MLWLWKLYSNFNVHMAGGWQMVHIRPQRNHQWHSNICLTMATRHVFQHRINQCQVSVARSICCKPLANHVLLKGWYKELNITGHEIRTASNVVHNVPAITPDIQSPVGSMQPSDFDLFGSLTKHLAARWFATDTDKNASCHLLPTGIWHRFFSCYNTSLGAKVGQILQ